ncbi:nicotinate (nicotinamide) nucleotide adenylyltransferase [Candidatus Dependentiae bacterium]|nr:nicotinate (nicotinamide) nucleotide adenylyltransferase [Candidatus Dependentiae bacterium]
MIIGVFGGTFNPPHTGHKKIIEKSFSILKIDKMLVIPAFIPPHKELIDNIEPSHKINMLNIIFKEMKNLEIVTSEIDRGGVSYTIDTIKSFISIYGNHDYRIIIGADNFNIIDSWKNIDELIKLCGFIVFSRTGEILEYEKQSVFLNNKNKFTVINEFDEPVSSSMIRNYVKNKMYDKAAEFLDREILYYIKKNKIYANNE